MRVTTICLPLVLFICIAASIPSFAQTESWGAAMGRSGLRRLYSTGGDLGELLSRQATYRNASRSGRANSDVTGYVAQWDSLTPVAVVREQPLLVRGLARVARSFDPGIANGRNDRFDLGILYAPTRRSYIAAGLADERTGADLKYVDGETRGNGVGPRVDAGVLFGRTVALGVRAEELFFDGSGRVFVTTPTGRLQIDRATEYRRSCMQAELMSRYGRAQLSFLPARVQLGWMGGVQYLATRYEPESDSRGQPVIEPFGNKERLGIAREGVFFSTTFGRRNSWNANIELMFDHEFNTNMNHPIDDRTTRYVRGGLAYVLKPGKRIQFDYQGFRSVNGLRSRDNFTLIGLVDF
jgi:hypothetical protein